MNDYLDQRISPWAQLGATMGILAESGPWPGYESGLSEEEYLSFLQIIETHYQYNGWFTQENIRKALWAWNKALTAENLKTWLSAYELKDFSNDPKNVGLICAGNIPLVGFHDVLSVLISGHKAIIKLSSDDNRLIPALLNILCVFEPAYKERFELMPRKLEGHDAVIATGSNNTARYFNYYFRDVPHIIRKSRTSIAVLDGTETKAELTELGHDIFDYFGLGCRNVSKIYVPQGYDINRFFEAIYDFHPIVNHNKYANNYDYNKAVWLLNCENLLDNGFILLKEEKRIASPTGSLYFEHYADRESITRLLNEHEHELQCVIGKGFIEFGESQAPHLWDYADGVDTMSFLSELHKKQSIIG